MQHPIDPRIFRAYDIRGRAHEQLTPSACKRIGQAFGSYLRESITDRTPAVCIGRDARTHGPELEQAVIDGLLASGCMVWHIGQTPSPVNYFTVCNNQLDGGIQVTASHNPAEDNGLKLCTANAHAFAGDSLQLLRKRIEDGELLEGTGTLRTFDATTPYADAIAELLGNTAQGLRIGVDSGNGVAGPLYCDILRRAGADVHELYTEPDGTFPHHAADPSKHETLRDLQALVREKELDGGLAFDGDGDRVGLVDELGGIRTADDILLLLTQDHLQRYPGAPVVFTVSNSAVIPMQIAAWGGTPVMCKVGHSFVEHAMLEHGALLGGEQSGHFFCGESYFVFDDAIVAALRILALRQAAASPLSAMLASFPAVFQSPEYRPYVHDDHKGGIVSSAAAHFGAMHDVITIDGVRIEFGDGAWAGIRQSNTSPCISICMEASSPQRLREIEDIVLSHLQTYPEIRWE